MWGISRSVSGRVCSLLLSAFMLAGSAFQAVPAFASSGEDAPAQPSPATAPVAPEPEPVTVVRELEGERTEKSTSYLLSDGNVKTVFSGAPVRFEGVDGAWRDIDTTLVPGDLPAEVVSASTSVTAAFASQRPDTPPVTLRGDDFSIGVNMLGVVEDTKLVSGDTVRYLDDAGRGVTLEYKALDSGIKETVVLASADAPASFEFTIALDGVELRQVPGGTFGFYRPDEDEMLFELGSLSVSDSFGGEYSPDHAVCTDTTMTVGSVDAGTVKVRYEISPEWLADPARVFPVMVDPTIASPVTDTWIHEGSPSYSGWSADGWMNVGASSGKQLWSLVKFDLAGVPTGAEVVSADLNLYQFAVTGSNSTITRCTADSAFSNSTSWNTRPATTTWSSVSYPGGAGQWIDLDVTNIVTNWLAATPVNHGFVLKGATTGTNYRQFRTKDSSTSSERPTLVVVWAPKAITGLSAAQTASSGWFREVDRDSDGRADTPNDHADEGRGAVELSWSASTLADGYNIWLHDGNTYRKVGQTIGNDATTWSSEGGRFFTEDSNYASLPDDSLSADPFSAAQPLMASRLAGTIDSLDHDGAGVVVSDGTHLYYRAWGPYAGPSQWTRIGSGLGGTTAGADPTGVGPDFGTKYIRSAFYLDGMIYNGYADTPTTIEGIPVGAAEEDTSTTTLTFSDPLLDRLTGAPLASGETDQVLLAATGERIYSVSYNLSEGDTKDGFRIREYDRDGTLIGSDHDIEIDSYLTDGLIADGDNLYLIEWAGSGDPRVTKVSTRSWEVTGQWKAGWQDSRAINGCYDAANDVVWMGAFDEGVIGRYKGLGLDLRDDPNELYRKTIGETYDAVSTYRFLVAPYSDAGGGELPWSKSTVVTTSLENRTVGVDDDPRHVEASLGDLLLHDGAAYLERGSLELDVTDLSIASWGPAAELTRHYSSQVTNSTGFGKGWRFNYEQNLAVVGTTATYTDASLDEHVFRQDESSGIWAAPNGYHATLTEPSGSTYRLTFNDQSYLTFDATSGRLLSETHQNGQAVTYAWTEDVTITAANGQQIVVDRDVNGKAMWATYSTADGTRRVDYSAPGSTASVDYCSGEYGTRTWDYAYGESGGSEDRLTRIEMPNFNSAEPDYTGLDGMWDFDYDAGGKLVSYAPVRDGFNTFKPTPITYGSATATLDRNECAQETYTWNPTSTLASKTNPAEESELWRWGYDVANEAVFESSPMGRTRTRTLDSRGNVLTETDESGNMTRSVYDTSNRLIRQTTPRGSTTYYTYSGNDLTVEERVLDASGTRSRTEYGYNAQGLMTQRRDKLDATQWAITDYGDFAPSGEPQTTTQQDVKLTAAGAPQDLTSHKTYDEFGNLLSEKDASGTWVAKLNTYSVAGNLLTSEVVSGTVTHYGYTRQGWQNKEWTTTATQTVNSSTIVFDMRGKIEARSQLDIDEDPVITETNTLDDAGNVIKVWYDMGSPNDPNYSSENTYDASNRTTGTRERGHTSVRVFAFDADGNQTLDGESNVTSYTPSGHISRIDKADGTWTRYSHDADGNQVSETSPTDGDEATKTSVFDLGGRCVRITDESGNVTTYAYDLAGRQLAAGIDGSGSSATVYNSLGWELSKTDADGIVTATTYDEAGRVCETSVADKVTTTDYDDAGRVTSRTDADNKTVSYTYDPFSRVTRERETQGGVTLKDTTTTYDEFSRVVATERGGDLSTATTYDGSVVSATNLAYPGAHLSTTYDKRNLVTETTVDLGTVSTSWEIGLGGGVFGLGPDRDIDGRALSWKIGGKSQSATYDSAGKLLTQDGMGFGGSGADYTYGDSGRKTSETVQLAYPDTTLTGAYGYTDTGRLSSATVNGDQTTYRFDAAGNLDEVRGASDPATTTLSYDAGNRVVSMGSTAFGWDTAQGRRTSMRRSGETSVTYEYSDAGRLSSFADPNAGVSATYAYDASGQRTHASVTRAGVSTETTYTYDGLTLLSLCSAASDGATSTITYVYDESSRPYAASYTGSEASETVLFHLITTDRGDVVELTDKDGTPFATYAYDAWGNPVASGTETRAAGVIGADLAAGIAGLQPLRYAGYAYDGESGLYYLSQRYYDPATSQFLTKDPARDDGEESAYQYCGGDPVGKVDPSGLYSWVRTSRTRVGWKGRFFSWAGHSFTLGADVGFAIQKQRRIIERLWQKRNTGTALMDRQWRFDHYEHRYRRKYWFYVGERRLIDYRAYTSWRRGY